MSNKIIQTFKTVFNELNRDTIGNGLLESVYRDDLEFIDPIHSHPDLASFKRYCVNLYENVESIHFDFFEEFVFENIAILNWVMTVQHPRLNGGSPFRVNGSSQLKFDERKIYWHRDYYDLGEMIYEHVPLVGKAVRFLKERLQ